MSVRVPSWKNQQSAWFRISWMRWMAGMRAHGLAPDITLTYILAVDEVVGHGPAGLEGEVVVRRCV